MSKNFFEIKNDVLIAQRRIAVLSAFIMLVIVLILSICLLRKETMTILVPFGFSDKITVSSKKPQNDYLEAISRDIIYTLLNLTPTNVDYAEKTVLSYANGSSYGGLKVQMEDLKSSVISKKFNTVFYPSSIYPDNSTLTVVIDGILYTYFGQKEVSRDKKKYEIKYDYNAGRLFIIGFSEIVEEAQDINK